MTAPRPKYVTFDCYGTLTRFQMVEMTRDFFADRVAAADLPTFITDFKCYRLDEVLGAWKPYAEVIHNALERTCKRWNIAFRPEEALAIYVPTWGPHADVPAGLAKVAAEIPLVILSNASNDQIQRNVDKLGAPFHAVFTAQQAQAYKPRMQAFEYMLDELGCGPEDVLHVSASLRYDLMTAHDLRITNKVYVNRGYEPSTPAYGYHEITDIGGLPGVLGL
jgi:2-haloacid dehalogenase